MKTYTTVEASEKLGITTRAIQKKCKTNNVRKKDNKYLITDKLLEEWNEQTNEYERTDVELIYEEFDVEQYNKLQEVIYNYPKLLDSIQDYRNQITYLKKSLDKKEEQMDVLINSINKSLQAIQQGQFLNAKDKGYDKK
jgi:predicted transcriptional regulator